MVLVPALDARIGKPSSPSPSSSPKSGRTASRSEMEPIGKSSRWKSALVSGLKSRIVACNFGGSGWGASQPDHAPFSHTVLPEPHALVQASSLRWTAHFAHRPSTHVCVPNPHASLHARGSPEYSHLVQAPSRQIRVPGPQPVRHSSTGASATTHSRSTLLTHHARPSPHWL